jgi:hypothetical protein
MTICPICKSEAKELDRIGDASGFDCPKDGKFKVAGTVFVLASAGPEPIGREQWEAAFEKAKGKTMPGAWPLITTYDF